jgi:hypothetical protein
MFQICRPACGLLQSLRLFKKCRAHAGFEIVSLVWPVSNIVYRSFGVRVAFSRRQGKVYAEWTPPDFFFLSNYSLVVNAV